jgi:hypothetical protein
MFDLSINVVVVLFEFRSKGGQAACWHGKLARNE